MPKLAELNELDRAAFTGVIGPVFEHSPWIAERAWTMRPFATREDLLAALAATLRASSDEERLSLIRAHPDLVARTVLTRESQGEQASAGLNALSAEDARQFHDYNSQYRARFGFPFVICARINKKDAILDAFPKRLQNSREQEIETALGEICRIAELRLHDLIP